MRRSLPSTISLTLAAALVAGMGMTDSASAQQKSNSMFNADTYWSGYWDWYDTEYVPAYRLRVRPPLVGDFPPNRAYVQPGASPAISGAPDAGGDYDDYAAEFYVPGGAREFYDKPGSQPAGDVVRPLEGAVTPRPDAVGTDPAAVVTDPDTVVTDPNAPRTIRPRARTAEERSRIPPDIDAGTPEPERPVAESKPEVWY